MTAPDPRVGEIQARLAAATPGPWHLDRDVLDEVPSVVTHKHDGALTFVTYIADTVEAEGDANFIAHSPADVAYLLGLLRERDAQIAAVESMHVMEYIEDGEHSRNRCMECLYEAEDREDCPTIEAIRAAVAAANGDKPS